MRLNGTEYPEYIPNKHNWIQKTLNQKLTNISEVICDIDADIIGLQEIENANALKLLQKSLKKYGCNYKYSAITHKPKSAIQIALLSKIPIKNSKDITVTKALGVRNILKVKFIIDSYPLYIYVNHWNSKRSPNQKRVLSALALKKELKRLPKESEYILLGDFNSNYNEYQIKDIFNTKRECNLNRDSFSHYNLWIEKPIYQRWSHNFYGKKTALDEMIISPTLLDNKKIDYIKNSFDVFKKKYIFHKKGYILRWEYKKNRHKGVGYSDHLPIFAKFITNPKKDKKIECNISISNIKELYNKNIKLPILLKKIKVINISKKSATIKQGRDKIVIFGIDKPLELNKEYNIIVYKRKFYNGSYEIVDFDIY